MATGTMIGQGQPVAVLVDGENISADHAEFIVQEAQALGPVTVRRVFGNFSGQAGWLAANGFTPVQTHTGKNSADMRLCVDAMDLFLRVGLRQFVLASSDGDFSHLANHLREAGGHVVGVGRASTSPHYRTICTTFIEIDHAPTRPGSSGVRVLSDIERTIIGLLCDANRPWTSLGLLGNRLATDHNISACDLHEGKLSTFLSLRTHLFECSERDGMMHVRLR